MVIYFILAIILLIFLCITRTQSISFSGGKKEELVYGIQEHHASRLHWDLRLQKPNSQMLWSWAIPKNIPRECCTRRLAIKQPDHDMDWMFFQGNKIGSKKFFKGPYGRGDVILWDIGTYELLKRTKNKFMIDIKGKKIKGIYYIMKYTNKDKKEHWMIFKKK